MSLVPHRLLAASGLGEKDSFDPVGAGADTLISYLSWGVSAAAVGGLMIVGIQMAVQLRRGEMGEGATYFRGGFVVMGACVLGATAGPLVEFVVKPFL